MNDPDNAAQLVSSAARAIAIGDLRTAERLSRDALGKDESDGSARLILGVALARNRQPVEASEHLAIVLAGDPASVDALTWMSDCLRRLGRFGEALMHSERSVELSPGKPDPLFGSGMCLIALGRYAEAETRLREAVALSRYPMALHFLGVALMRQDKLEEALSFFEEARRREPKVPNHLIAIGQVRLIQRRGEEAIVLAKEALRLNPASPAANLLIAQSLAREGNSIEALSFVQRAIEIDSRSPEAYGLLGMLEQQMGRFSEAEEHLDLSLSLDPSQATPVFCKVQSRKLTAADESLVERMLSMASSTQVSPHEKMVLEYALGKALDDLDNPAEAMAHFDAANRLSYDLYQRLSPWDTTAFESLIDSTIKLFDQLFVEKWAEFGNISNRPIFVLGMIRSGTTLMEQLLSAHPDVAGAGELHYWFEEGPKSLDTDLQELVPERMKDLADRYLRILEATSADTRFVTDKMPLNVIVLGFIHACLPNARIIHMVRDPVDTCLSIWTTYFRKPPEFGNNKGTIVQAFLQHERLREHWTRVLPPSRFLTVSYEDLTRSPEPVMRRVLDFCDLEWNEDCIHPEKNDRFVTTPSLWRVRKPVDSASVNKAERYGPYLGEFGSFASK